MARSFKGARIGLLISRGDLATQKKTVAIYEGLTQIAEKHEMELEVIENNNDAEFEKNLIRVLESGYSFIATRGAAYGNIAEHLASQHDRTLFLTADHLAAPESFNVISINLPPEELAEGVRYQIDSFIEGGGFRAFEGFWGRLSSSKVGRALLTPFLALVTALIVGAFFIAAFDPQVWAAFKEGFFSGLGTAFQSIGQAYGAMFEGAFGSPVKIFEGFRVLFQTGENASLLRAIFPLMESIRISTPYIFTGLAVAFAFNSGMFSIGAEGQYFIGGLATVFVGYAITGLPWFIHLPLALLAGFAGGAFWAAIAGWLKARTGASEVINTIMLNYIAYRVADFLLQVNGPMARPGESRPVSPEIMPSAYLPQFFPDSLSLRVNFGFVLAIIAVFVINWLLYKTTVGFEMRTVGANPRAAKTAGINIKKNYVLSMGISGGLAGLAASHDILGVIHYMPNAFSAGYGFDAIALALLGKNNPIGVLFAALLFGFLRAGAQRMQAYAQVPIDIIQILQGLIIIFVAAPEVIKLIYRLKELKSDESSIVTTTGWN